MTLLTTSRVVRPSLNIAFVIRVARTLISRTVFLAETMTNRDSTSTPLHSPLCCHSQSLLSPHGQPTRPQTQLPLHSRLTGFTTAVQYCTIFFSRTHSQMSENNNSRKIKRRYGVKPMEILILEVIYFIRRVIQSAS